MEGSDEVLFVKGGVVFLRGSVGKLQEHGRKEELYFLMTCMQNSQFDLNHAVKVPLIFQPELNFLFALRIPFDFGGFSDNIKVVIVGIVLIRKFKLSVVFVFVVDEDVNLSALEVNQVKRSDCNLDLSASIKNNLLFEEAEF